MWLKIIFDDYHIFFQSENGTMVSGLVLKYYREKYTLAPKLSPILQLCLQTLKSDIEAIHTIIVCQIRHFCIFSFQNTLEVINKYKLKNM